MYVISILSVIACVLVVLVPLVGRNQSGEQLMNERVERSRARKLAGASVVPMAPGATAEPVSASDRRAA